MFLLHSAYDPHEGAVKSCIDVKVGLGILVQRNSHLVRCRNLFLGLRIIKIAFAMTLASSFTVRAVPSLKNSQRDLLATSRVNFARST